MRPRISKLKLESLRQAFRDFWAWEFWLLMLATVAVVGLATRGGGVNELPSLFSSLEPYRIQQVELDPYDVDHDSLSPSESRNNVETGL